MTPTAFDGRSRRASSPRRAAILRWAAATTVGGFKVLRHIDQAGRECAFYDTTLMFPFDVYEVDADCRHPELVSSLPVGLLGHESGLSPDGNTFYSASPGTSTVQALALEGLPAMTPVWTSVGEYPSHGLSVSDDGNRIYIAGLDGLHIVDVSDVQARVPLPEVTEVAHLAWDTMSIPQNALPVTIGGARYLIEIDELGSGSRVGAVGALVLLWAGRSGRTARRFDYRR